MKGVWKKVNGKWIQYTEKECIEAFGSNGIPYEFDIAKQINFLKEKESNE